MTKYDINKAFVSPIDKFLFNYDKDHEKSLSQLKEIAKHKRIAILRDDPNPLIIEEIWTEF